MRKNIADPVSLDLPSPGASEPPSLRAPRAFDPTILAGAFYRHVEGEPTLRSMYAKHLGCAIHGLEAFLVRLVGGESDWPSQPLHAFHRKLKIDIAGRDAWLRCMTAAVEETVADAATRDELLQLFRGAATQLVNREPVEESAYGRWPCPAEAGSLEQAWSQHEAADLAFQFAVAGETEKLRQVIPDVCVPLEDVLRAAANVGQIECVQVLIEAGADARRISVSGPMLIQQPECAEFLLAKGATVNGVNGGEPPLIRSCRGDRGNRIDEVRALLARGVDVNQRGRLGRTALHYASRARFTDVVQLLLEHGADASLEDDKGNKPG